MNYGLNKREAKGVCRAVFQEVPHRRLKLGTDVKLSGFGNFGSQ
ncbi:UNVERIFIED_CONTAM: hypothetical protein GTU68_055336 [Idotea baltica]|nr:hypothetical protein [Idotea baltica]